MRPANRSELDSLYFDYPYFDAPRERTNSDAKVLIVGAGPIGMTAALTLAKYGIKSLLIDAKSTFNDGSRAICIARASYYIFERLGILKPFLQKSLGWTTGRSFYRGQQILEFEMPDSPSEKFRPMYNLQQQYIEQFLWDAVADNPLIETRWQTKLVDLTQSDETTHATVEDPNGQYTIESDWLLAADGARSTTRSLCDLRLKGENYEGRYVIADIQMAHDYPTIRRALFDPACRPGGTVLIHKQPDNIWRIDYQLGDDESAETAILEQNVRASVRAVLHDIDYQGACELEWWSIYSANTLALDDYRHGRVFFIGDSAHIVPIFGVRGLNNGLADAFNIGWKLARVLNHQCTGEILDSYTPERRGATLDVFANASKSARFMTPPTAGFTLMRDAALSLSLDHPFAGQLANPRQMTPYTYAQSPIVVADDTQGFNGGPKAGAMLPECNNDGEYLTDQLGDHYSVIVFDQALGDSLVDTDAKIIALSVESAIAKQLNASASSAYIIRPDLHIAARWKQANPSAIRNYLSNH